MTTPLTQTHICPAQGCTVTLPFAIFACRLHWAQTPRALRWQITRAWRAWLTSQPGESHARYQEYLAVRQQAVDALTEAVAS